MATDEAISDSPAKPMASKAAATPPTQQQQEKPHEDESHLERNHHTGSYQPYFQNHQHNHQHKHQPNQERRTVANSELELSTDTDDDSMVGEPDSSNTIGHQLHPHQTLRQHSDSGSSSTGPLLQWDTVVEALGEASPANRDRVLHVVKQLLAENAAYARECSRLRQQLQLEQQPKVLEHSQRMPLMDDEHDLEHNDEATNGRGCGCHPGTVVSFEQRRSRSPCDRIGTPTQAATPPTVAAVVNDAVPTPAVIVAPSKPPSLVAEAATVVPAMPAQPAEQPIVIRMPLKKSLLAACKADAENDAAKALAAAALVRSTSLLSNGSTGATSGAEDSNSRSSISGSSRDCDDRGIGSPLAVIKSEQSSSLDEDDDDDEEEEEDEEEQEEGGGGERVRAQKQPQPMVDVPIKVQ